MTKRNKSAFICARLRHLRAIVNNSFLFFAVFWKFIGVILKPYVAEYPYLCTRNKTTTNIY